MSTHVPHTVRTRETKTCTDCHVSTENDNNAIMAQLLLQGTNLVNFMGVYAYVGTGEGGFEAVQIAEREEPQAIIGSTLHADAYPEEYRKHEEDHKELKTAHHHHGHVSSLQLRGEYLYAAGGSDGLVIYDVAQIDHKGFSERMTSAPVSPIGQRLRVRTKHATAVASPSTLAVDPVRDMRPENQEQDHTLVHGFLYVTDFEEGLIVVLVATLLDGDPTNNFLERNLTYNPDGLLDGAVNIEMVGNHAYISCDRGLVILDMSSPLEPVVTKVLGAPEIVAPRSVKVQFRYAFVVDSEGLKVVDVTLPENARVIPSASIAIPDARDIYLARTYAYVAAGSEGLRIIDIERPEQPRDFLTYNAGGEINDTYSVRLAMTNASLFAYLADGKHGMRVLQLTAPKRTPAMYGFSPTPEPELIATYHTHEPAIALSEALDRDRGVDESGNQLVVFGRRGARPFNLEEMRRLFMRNGEVFVVSDNVPAKP